MECIVQVYFFQNSITFKLANIIVSYAVYIIANFFYTDGLQLVSGLSGDLKIAISTSITAFVVGSILFFIIGFLCRHLYQTETVREIQGPTYYHNKPEQEIELKENVAYGPIQA